MYLFLILVSGAQSKVIHWLFCLSLETHWDFLYATCAGFSLGQLFACKVLQEKKGYLQSKPAPSIETVWETAWKAGSWSAHLLPGSAHLFPSITENWFGSPHPSQASSAVPSLSSPHLEPHHARCLNSDNIMSVPGTFLKLLLRLRYLTLFSLSFNSACFTLLTAYSSLNLCFLLHYVLFLLPSSKCACCFLCCSPTSPNPHIGPLSYCGPMGTATPCIPLAVW